jgi:hypothetical protein
MYQSSLKGWNFHNLFVDALKSLNIKTMLDYGGGIGEYSILAEQNGIKPVFSEIANSKTLEYAKYRFAKYGVTPIIKDENYNIEYYDLIVAMDIFEHLPDPQPIIKKISENCKYILCNMPGELPYNEFYPQHISHYELSNDFELAGSYVWRSKYKPKVSIILPTLGRPDGLKRCLDSIDKLNYPKELIQTIVLDGPGTVPEKVAKGLAESTGEYLVYAANDMEFDPDAIKIAIDEDRNHGLVAFGGHEIYPDKGNINEHFLIHRDLVKDIGGEIFDTEFFHLGVDNLLWAKATKLNRAIASINARVIHYHFSQGSTKDEVYQKGWSMMEQDRELLKKKLEELK